VQVKLLLVSQSIFNLLFNYLYAIAPTPQTIRSTLVTQ
jgi:hypothetical protein